MVYAARALIRRPIFSLLNLGLLTIASASIAAVFAVVSATLLRPLPFREPDRLVAISTTEPVTGDSLQVLASAAIQLARWRAESRTLADVAGWTPVTLNLSGDGEPRALRGFSISASLFDMLGTPPEVGRSFRAEEETPAPGVVIISHDVAEKRFGGAAAAIGKRVTLDGNPSTVVGVMPAGYSMLFQGGDVWIPYDLTPAQQAKPRLRMLAVYGRLRAGAGPSAALAELTTIQRRLRDEQPDAFRTTGLRVTPLRENLFGTRRASMIVLLCALGLIMLIAGANVGNLMIADASARRPLTMTRLAIGGSQGSIVRMRIAETALLVVTGAVLGLVLAFGALSVLVATDASVFTALGDNWIDWRVALAVFGGATMVGFGAALPVGFSEARVDLASIASSGIKAAGARGDRRSRQLLVALQVAVTTVLLAGTVLLGRHVLRLLASDTGFDQRSTLAVLLNLPGRDLPTVEARAQYVESLVNAVKAVPGVEGVSTIQTRFIIGETMGTGFEIQDRAPVNGGQDFAQIRHVMPDVNRVLGIHVLRGRGIDSTDRAGAVPVAMVSESFARTYWPGQDALGKQVRRAGRADAKWLTVVGVVADITDAGVGAPIGPTLYVPYLQQNTPTARVTLVARSRVKPSSLGKAIREAVWKVNPAQAIDEISAVSTLMSRTAAQPRFQALVVGAFGVASMLLVVAGVYALTLFSVVGRTRELGVRSALGATPGNILRLAVGGSMVPVCQGAAIGAVLAYPVATLIQRTLAITFKPGDVPLLVVAVLVLIAVSGIGALIPARRAARVSPSVALRA